MVAGDIIPAMVKDQKSTSQPSLICPNTKLDLILKWTNIQTEYQRQLQKLAVRVRLPGFRRGFVPAKLAEPVIGRDQIIEQVFRILLPPAFSKKIQESRKKSTTSPSFHPQSIKWGEDWLIEAQIAEPPVISLGNYAQLVKKTKIQFHHQSRADQNTSNQPHHHSDDNHSSDLTHHHHHSSADDQLLSAIFKALVLSIKPRIPELLVQSQVKSEFDRLTQTLKQLKLSLDDYLARRHQTPDDLAQDLAASALGQLQLEFILQAIADRAQLNPTDIELQTEFQQLVKDPNTQRQPQVDKYLTTIITRRKINEHLLSL